MSEQEVNNILEPKTSDSGFHVQALVDAGRIIRDEVSSLHSKLQAINVPSITDEQIALFLLACDREQSLAIDTIKEFFKSRLSMPELFDEWHLERDDLQYQLNVVRYAILPRRMPDGCTILLHAMKDHDYLHYNLEHSLKLLCMTLDAAVYDQAPTGLVMIFDMQGVGLMHLTRWKITLMKRFLHYLQVAVPLKLKTIYILNTEWIVHKFLMFIKPFMKKELYDTIHLQAPTDDYREFHAACIPRHCLPSDYQGDLPSVDELHMLNAKKLEKMRPYFDAEQKKRHDFYVRQGQA